MSFIKIIRNREKKAYVYLYENYREGNKIKGRQVYSFGQLELLEKQEPGFLQRVKKEAKLGLLDNLIKDYITVKFDLYEKQSRDDDPDNDKNYGWFVLDELFKEFQLDKFIKKAVKKYKIPYELCDVIKLLTYARIIFPASKSKTVKLQNMFFGDWDINQNYMDRSLDYFKTIREDMFLHLHQQQVAKMGRISSVVFYDVTNYYYTNDIDDIDVWDEDTGELVKEGMRKRGCSKENRPNPIVQMGLFMDSNGIPVSYKLFPGNTHDCSTYKPALEEIVNNFKMNRVIITADKAMNSKKNIMINHKSNHGYIYSQKVRGKYGVPKDVQEFAIDVKSWKIVDEDFAYKSMVHERKLDKDTIIKEKVIVTWRREYAERDQRSREECVDRAKKMAKPPVFRKTCKKGSKRYLIPVFKDPATGEMLELNCDCELDKDLIHFDSLFDGINVLVTSEIDADDMFIINQYRQLHFIEDCFRITKSGIQSRPIYVTTPEHIEAHFFTCFLALYLIRNIYFRINKCLSSEKIIEGLKSAKCGELGEGYLKMSSNDDFKLMIEKLNIEEPYKYIPKFKLENFDKYYASNF
ncbi:MAG: IS1634 family transposase [Oscillospiraceae bacterium]|nr:IS1634 family transposase [Oscillospiraceae bacterium]